MNREELKRRIAVEQAFLDGADIESISQGARHTAYSDSSTPCFNWAQYNYRIKAAHVFMDPDVESIGCYRGKGTVAVSFHNFVGNTYFNRKDLEVLLRTIDGGEK